MGRVLLVFGVEADAAVREQCTTLSNYGKIVKIEIASLAHLL